MSDIHQEWHELRKKNGDFICHLDGEMAKLEKEKKTVTIEEINKNQIFYDPVTCTYYHGEINIEKAIDAQYWQEKHAELMLELKDAMAKINNLKEENKRRIDQTQKAAADYQALSNENLKLKEDIKRRKDSAKILSDAYVKAIEENADLRKRLDAAQTELADFIAMYDKAAAEAHQAKVAKDRMGYSNRCMQSKIAKQSNEIKRLTEDVEANFERCNMLRKDKADLKESLKIVAKDAESNFYRGYHKGMDELWAAIRKAQEESPSVLTAIYGQGYMHDCVSNLSAYDFAKKTMEWEDKQAEDIQIGDEVEIFDTSYPDDNPHSDIGIVVAVNSDGHSFAAVGPNFEGCFDETDILRGNVKKTGKHFESIPIDYFT